MGNNEITTGEILDFLKENMVTKDDMREYVGGQIQASEQRLISHIDRFAKLHEALDTELIAMRGKYDRLESRLEIVEQKLGLAGA
ncbi:hypothetical protein A2856_03265 [Candidatus Uhrbacteria bacterium RIFCSPHIGHO2_01_FULL_63_20]|uniref:Uncharacterized protein n=1 Tax=Candidatus Uhrbacteria bacterium RIFCSPHIGHO2_01_FULL_63_20 TaxID=1802385 RepID=A0A1F7TMA5_9BACT|nr:MAG: hypothetical protein A2856_03265 [Candidatus Uhrbacteria bacterium RIFCSPHIGHO2_01_FULL_63_20]